jgi:hypothetical protein
MSLNPFTLIAIGIGILVGLLLTAYHRFDAFKKIVDTVFGAIKWWVTNVTIPVVESLLGVFKTVFNGIASIWNNTVGKVSFEVPSWVPGVGGKGFKMPKIPMLADGGIIKASQGGTLAIIGEGGQDEAVIPLNRLNNYTNGNGTNVTIHVNGGDPRAVVDALRKYMQTHGAVPIRIGGA